MEKLIGFLVLGGVMAAAVMWLVKAHKRAMAEFATWAAAQGLTVAEGNSWTTRPEAAGMRNGRRVKVRTYTTGSGKSQQTWLVAEIALIGAGRLELSFARQGFGTKVAEWFGAKEVTVGEPGFDARWFIRTNREDFVRAALLPEMRTRIDEVAGLGGRAMRVEVKDGWSRYVEQGGVNAKACARLERALPLVEELAVLAEVEGSAG